MDSQKEAMDSQIKAIMDSQKEAMDSQKKAMKVQD